MISIELWCDSCPDTYGTHWLNKIRELRREAKKDGWKYLKGTFYLPSSEGYYGDFCPKCIKEADKNE